MVKESNSLRNKKLHSSKPYDVSNSFVKKVTSRVTNLLPQPAWLSRWFTPNADNEHDKDVLNSSDLNTEEDDNIHLSPNTEEDDNIHLPPAKKAKIPLNQAFPPNSFQISPVSSNLVSGQWPGTSRSTQNEIDLLDMAQAGPSGINTRQQPVSSTPNIQSTTHLLAGTEHKMNGGDDQSESSESTSGCSSLVPQANRQFQDGQSLTNSLSARRRSIDEKLNFTGHLQSSRSLFSDRSPRLNSSVTRRRPSFNVSSFSSPLLEKDRSSLKNKITNSPFYSGKTTYGGASAYRRSRDGFFLSNEQTSQKRCGVQVKPVNCEPDTLSSMSTTARRILEALEEFSTPVLDAKRIPLEPSTPPLSSKRKRLHDSDSSPGIKSGQAPRTPHSTRSLTCGLTIPTVPDLLKMRHREKLQDSLEAARLIAASTPSNVISPCVSASKDYKLGVDNSRKEKRHGGKIRSKEKGLEEETVEKVDLPNISLPVTSLPKFDFVVPPATSTPPVTSTFKFASPITVTKNARTCLPIENFTFSKPLSANGDIAITENKKNVSYNDNFIPYCPTKLQFKSGSDKLLLREKDNKSNLCKSNRENSEVRFGIQPSTELKTGSVMDFLSKEPNREDTKIVSSSSGSLLDKFKPAQGTWECGTCMIRNKSDAERCAACETPRVTVVKPPAATQSDKLSRDKWQCQSCHTHNLHDVSVCSKCSAVRGGQTRSAKDQMDSQQKSLNAVSGFGNKFKPPSGTWECDTCLVRNPDSSKQCQACETKRPVLTTKSSPVSQSKPVSSAGFGDLFKKPKGSWDCPDCMVQNKEDSLKCVACERAKPGTETQSSIKYNFTIPAEASNFKFGIDKAGGPSTAAVSSSTDLQGFRFGETKVTVAQSFSFGVPVSVSSTTKPDTVNPGINSAGAGFSTLSGTVAKVADANSLSQIGTAPSSSLTNEKRPNEDLPKKRRSSIVCEEEEEEDKDKKSKDIKENSELIKPSTNSAESAMLNKKVDELPDSKKAPFTFGFIPGSSSFTNEKPNISTKTESAAPSFSFGAQSTGATSAGLNFSSLKPSTTPNFSFITPHSTSLGNNTASNTTISTSTTAMVTSTTSSNSAVCTTSTTTAAPAVTNIISSVKTTASSNLFTFGSSNSGTSFRNPGLSFGQSSVSTAPPISFGTVAKTTASPVFSFNTSTSQIKPFAVNKESIDNTASKTQTAALDSVTDAAPVNVFGGPATTTTSTGPSITSSSVPGFGSPSLTLGARSTVPVFGTLSTTASSTTTTTVGFGSVTTPNYSTAFPSLGEQKLALPTKSSASAGTFNFGSSTNTSAPSLGPTPSFSFGAVQNDQAGKGFNFGTQSGNTTISSNPSATPIGSSGFSFSSNNQAQSQMGTTFNFGSNVATTSANSSLFGSGTISSSTPAVFGAGNAASPFGASGQNTTTTASFTAPTFSFGSSSTQSNPNLFVFSPNQASGSTNLPVQNFNSSPATFNFNQSQSSTQAPAQPTLPTFNPNVRPSFNFTKGETPSFTAAAPAPGPQRRIKKAVRRTHPR